METPFTVEQFLGVFRDYNESVFPVQILLYLIALAAIYRTIKPNRDSNKIVGGILAFFWLWIGMVYHLGFFTAVNKAAYLFGALSILQGIFFLIFGVFKERLSFRFNIDIYGIAGIAMIFFALFVYPVFGYLNGHTYPSSPTFGLPCPTTIFTFGILLMTDKKFPLSILIVPFLWSLIGFMAVINFGIKEDIGLLVSGLISLALLVYRSKTYSTLRTENI